MSVMDRIQVIAAASSSSTSMKIPSSGSVGRPASSSASMMAAAAPALPSRSVLSVNRRKQLLERVALDGSGGRLVAQQLDQLAGERAQQVGLEHREGGHAGARAAVSLEATHSGSPRK
jgi:hypothetical protein